MTYIYEYLGSKKVNYSNSSNLQNVSLLKKLEYEFLSFILTKMPHQYIHKVVVHYFRTLVFKIFLLMIIFVNDTIC